MHFQEIPAKRLAVGDLFVKYDAREDAEENGWAWRVREHAWCPGPARGDYSTIVEYDGGDWTERFEPDEPVWLVTGQDAHYLIYRDIGWSEDDDGEQVTRYAELPVCGVCVPRNSHFRTRAEVPLWPCAYVSH